MPWSRTPAEVVLIITSGLKSKVWDIEITFNWLLGWENFSDNNVKIYNRWGVLVFEVDNYGNDVDSDNVFKGFSGGRITINQDQGLPFGTYFYVIKFYGENPGRKTYSGYLYLNN